eukprot:CAMPEP_0202920052 /NCGR_PEP_ID=MMETSP1392-20130828/76658_1 /ASSEMBLY_ACC=CAM_ASM_000868 /TAXON_ID=225041 /ORGANISM="Chlamydomonas chlamydogama, Strain SAG 11-48b" /LENGTH=585 /DNA_ID=CAMNT_0049613531 /DNA_START=621 /DNA_END=2378 /DNA_ORIENTATION=+
MSQMAWHSRVAIPLLTVAGCYLSVKALRYLSSNGQLSSWLQYLCAAPCIEGGTQNVTSAKPAELLGTGTTGDLLCLPPASAPLPQPQPALRMTSQPWLSASLSDAGASTTHTVQVDAATATHSSIGPRSQALAGDAGLEIASVADDWQQLADTQVAQYCNVECVQASEDLPPSLVAAPVGVYSVVDDWEQLADSPIEDPAVRVVAPQAVGTSSLPGAVDVPCIKHQPPAGCSAVSDSYRSQRAAPLSGRLSPMDLVCIQKDQISLWALDHSSSQQCGAGGFCRVLLLNLPVGHYMQQQQQRVLCALKLALPGVRGVRLDKEAHFMFKCGRSPLVVQSYGLVRSGGRCGLLMEVGLRDLGAMMKERQAAGAGGLPLHSVLHIARCLTQAVRDVHTAGVIHCDIKPQNVLLCGSTATPKLADFGGSQLSKHISKFSLVGTSTYLPPEMRGERCRPSAAWDWFSLGVTLLEVCLGRGLAISESEALGSASGLDWDMVCSAAPALQQCGGLLGVLQGLLQHKRSAREKFGRSQAAEQLAGLTECGGAELGAADLAGMSLPHSTELLGMQAHEMALDVQHRAMWVAHRGN